MLWYHAGEIYQSAGDTDIAANYMQDALQMDPQFDGIAAPKAAQMVAAEKAKRSMK
jgi:predicted TPR repeat methyltransferase